jgi:actin-related protein
VGLANVQNKVNKETACKIFYENLGVPLLAIVHSTPLALYASGKTTGLVLDVGDGLTNIVPVYDGYALAHAAIRTELAGRDVTDVFIKTAGEIGLELTGGAGRVIAQAIKEKHGYIAQDLAAAMKGDFQDVEYELPDGNKFKLGNLQFKCPEALFIPYLAGKECEGIPAQAFQCIKNAQDPSVKKALYDYVQVVGGSTLFPGFKDRFQKEIQALVPPAIKVNVFADAGRKYSNWIGGAIVGSLSSFAVKFVTDKEFADLGADAAFKKWA